MVRTTWDPVRGIEVSADEWEVNNKGKPGRCSICDNDIYIKANSAPAVSTHFAHRAGSNCPSVNNNRESYEILQPIYKDYRNAKQLKKSLLNNMEIVYQKCRSIFGENGFKRSDFQKLIRAGSDKNIWLYKDMTMKYLPYVLLVNYGVFQKEEHRKRKVYFVFDAKLSSYEDLWIRPGKIKQKLWRVYPEESLIEKVEIDFDTSLLSPDYFIFYATGLQKLENDFLKW
ncbi:hypothetical protein IHV12_19745 [Fictibacillus sp. 7GRE50]|uniref:hypothetical protein n=1 Tax=Fictibacillus sp. 7GRE50 TaxID=2745878 RepID=UPI0018CF87A6|nr:hypothetical protein [Fictibacillus sp. 7GRE50]MBH0167162.1 hypothetical protein [Fictibacillus sp. 7GRE50]